MAFSYDAEDIFSDYNTYGVSTSGKKKPRKAELRNWGGALERALQWPATAGTPPAYTLDTTQIHTNQQPLSSLSTPPNPLVCFRANLSCTGNDTIDVDSLGAKSMIVMLGGGGTRNLVVGDLVGFGYYWMTFSTTHDAWVVINPTGFGRGIARADAAVPWIIDRLTSDGTLTQFMRDGVVQGSITVSGSTVTYGAFAGMHWSQLGDNTQHPEILKGTVIETIGGLADWPDETFKPNDVLPRFKVSDTPESTSVYGVFSQWDFEGDAEIVALGAFMIRISAEVSPSLGDLLVSTGDGTATVQGDDIIRSKTIGKVISLQVAQTYEDGSYLLPCVLYCG